MSSLVKDLSKLADLWASSCLSDQEFTRAKACLMGTGSSAADRAYANTFQADLESVINELMKARPTDPHKFIAEAMLKKSARCQTCADPMDG
jgi:hypothetical protein